MHWSYCSLALDYQNNYWFWIYSYKWNHIFFTSLECFPVMFIQDMSAFDLTLGNKELTRLMMNQIDKTMMHTHTIVGWWNFGWPLETKVVTPLNMVYYRHHSFHPRKEQCLIQFVSAYKFSQKTHPIIDWISIWDEIVAIVTDIFYYQYHLTNMLGKMCDFTFYFMLLRTIITHQEHKISTEDQ